jgi:hypothetical protein
VEAGRLRQEQHARRCAADNRKEVLGGAPQAGGSRFFLFAYLAGRCRPP